MPSRTGNVNRSSSSSVDADETRGQGRIQQTGLGGGEFWPRGPHLLLLSTFFTDLGHFILKLLIFYIFLLILCLFCIFI